MLTLRSLKNRGEKLIGKRIEYGYPGTMVSSPWYMSLVILSEDSDNVTAEVISVHDSDSKRRETHPKVGETTVISLDSKRVDLIG